jgi:hypothetical protein
MFTDVLQCVKAFAAVRTRREASSNITTPSSKRPRGFLFPIFTGAWGPRNHHQPGKDSHRNEQDMWLAQVCASVALSGKPALRSRNSQQLRLSWNGSAFLSSPNLPQRHSCPWKPEHAPVSPNPNGLSVGMGIAPTMTP